MSSIITVLLAIVAATLLLATEVQAQTNGDIRLENNRENNQTCGRLEIFIGGQWGTICGKDGTNFKAVAETACRQLGLVFQGSYCGTVTELGFPVASNSTPIYFGSIDCGSSTSSGLCSTNYLQHVLCCAVDTKVNATACTHRNDIGVSCSSERIIKNPCKGQLILHPTRGQQSPIVSLSSGVLGILFENSNTNEPTLSLVCGEGFDEYAANTSCRQLGYTNANNYYFNTSLQTTNWTFWIAGINCKSQLHSCLNNCFSKTPTNQTSCMNQVYLECKFDLSLNDMESAITPRPCDKAVDNNCTNFKSHNKEPNNFVGFGHVSHNEEHAVTNVRLPSAVVVVIIVVVIVVILAACALCITLLVCCLVPGCLIHRKRSRKRAAHHISPKLSEALLTK